MKTANDLDNEINNAGSDYFGNPWFALYYRESDHIKTSIGLVELADSGPADPGDGKQIWVVVKFDGRYFRKTGYYSSWGSSEFDGQLEEVEPYEKTVIDYRSV